MRVTKCGCLRGSVEGDSRQGVISGSRSAGGGVQRIHQLRVLSESSNSDGISLNLSNETNQTRERKKKGKNKKGGNQNKKSLESLPHIWLNEKSTETPDTSAQETTALQVRPFPSRSVTGLKFDNSKQSICLRASASHAGEN